MRAIADYTESIRRGPADSEGCFGRARALLYANALPKALTDIEQGIEHDPEYT